MHADTAAEIFVGLSSGDERRVHDRSTGSTIPAFAAAETAAGPTSEMQGRLPVARARYAGEVKMSAEDAESIRAAMSGLDLPAPEWAKDLDVCTLQQTPSHAHTHAQTHKCFLVPSMHEHECARRSADAACSLDSHAERNTATARRLSSRSIPALEKLETPTYGERHVGTLGSLLERLHKRRFCRLLSRKGEYLAYLTYPNLKARSPQSPFQFPHGHQHLISPGPSAFEFAIKLTS